MNNEPVAWRWKYVDENGKPFTDWQYWHEEPSIPNKDKKYLEPLYTAPQIKELSDEEIKAIANNLTCTPDKNWNVLFARAILKASKK
jgi:hypothetical protein